MDGIRSGRLTIGSDLDMRGHRITGLAHPVDAGDAQTKLGITGSEFAPIDGAYIVAGSVDPVLTNERLLAGSSSITLTDNGPGSTMAISATQAFFDALYQPLDTGLTSFAALPTVADRYAYSTALNVWAEGTITSFARTILDDADAATVRTTIGAGTGAGTVTSVDGSGGTTGLTLTGGPITTTGTLTLGGTLAVANGGTGGADAATARTNLGLVIGTNVQAYDAELAALAGLTSAADRLPYFTGLGTAALATFTAAGRALVDDADATAQRTTLGLGAIATGAYPGAGVPNSTGSAWGTSFAPTTGRITFGAAGSTLDDDAALQWDDTNKFLGVLSAGSPGYPLHVYKTNTATAASSNRTLVSEISPAPASASSALFFGIDGWATYTGSVDINGAATAGIFAIEAKANHVGASAVQRVIGFDGKAFVGPDAGAASGTSTSFVLAQNIFEAKHNSLWAGTATQMDGVNSAVTMRGPGTVTYANALSATTGIQDGGSGGGVVTELCGVRVWPRSATTFVDTMVAGTVTNWFGVKVDDPTSGPTYTNAPEGLRIESFTPAGSIGVRQVSTSMTNRFAGNTRFGADTAPTVALDVTGNALVSGTLGVTGAVTLTNKVTTYNNTATVERGVPSVIASVASAATSAAVGSTNLIASTPATGFYRVTVQASETVAGTTSILGPFTIGWTDGNNSSAQQIEPQCTAGSSTAATSVSATSSALNTTTTKLHGSIVIYALTGTAITYTVGYTSTGTAMFYRYRLVLEAL